MISELIYSSKKPSYTTVPHDENATSCRVGGEKKAEVNMMISSSYLLLWGILFQAVALHGFSTLPIPSSAAAAARRCCVGTPRWNQKIPLASSLNNNDNDDNQKLEEDPPSATNQQAEKLLERAKQARLEAETMERDLVQQKLQTLQGLLDRQSQLSKSDEQDLQGQIDRLQRYYDKPEETNTTTTTTSVDTTTTSSSSDPPPEGFGWFVPFKKSIEEVLQENTLYKQILAEKGKNATKEDVEKILQSISPESMDNLVQEMKLLETGFITPSKDFITGMIRETVQNNLEIEKEYVKELTPEDKEALEQVQKVFYEFKDFLNITFGEDEDEDFWKAFGELEGDLQSALGGNITKDNLELINYGAGFVKGLLQGFGVKDEDWQDTKAELASKFSLLRTELAKDPLYMERTKAMKGTFPENILEAAEMLEESEMEDFVKQVMLPLDSVFGLSSINAMRVGTAYMLQGSPREGYSGDDVINRIDKQLVDSGLQGKFQCYYVRDAFALLDADEVQIADQIQNGEEQPDLQDVISRVLNLQSPSLVVTSPDLDLGPKTPPEARSIISFLALFSTVYFATNCYDQELADFGLSNPIVLGIIGLQLVHQLGHFAAAALNKVRLPTQELVICHSFFSKPFLANYASQIDIAIPSLLIPSPATGILTSHTDITSPPRNANAMFDFALSGPLLGIFASWGTLLLGLQMTAGVKSSDVALLPHMPLDFFQLSTLTSATIETFLGTDVLLSLDPVSDSVAVHPLVIAGHVGILINALNLLPMLPTSDGGRMIKSLVPKGADVVVFVFANIFLFVQGFRGWETSNALILYWFLVQFFLPAVDVPCRNNVDPATGLRAPVFAAATVLSMIALSPSF